MVGGRILGKARENPPKRGDYGARDGAMGTQLDLVSRRGRRLEPTGRLTAVRPLQVEVKKNTSRQPSVFGPVPLCTTWDQPSLNFVVLCYSWSVRGESYVSRRSVILSLVGCSAS